MLTDVALRLRARGLWLCLLAATLLAACSPDGFLVTDEERERNFQRARDAERLGDFDGAADHYERALERNPRAANVTLGYASLCETQLKRFADAAYLYQRYLKLVPDDPRAEDIRRRITICSERLATAVPVVIRSETIARDLETVRTENLRLKALTSNLVATAVYWSNEWRRASTTAAIPSAPPPDPSPDASAPALAQAGPATPRPGPVSGARAVPAPSAARRTPSGAPPASPAPSPSSASARDAGYAVDSRSARTPRANVPPAPAASAPARSTTPAPSPIRGPVRMHVVSSGDTLASVARRFGVSPAVVAQANPRVNTRQLTSGTILRIPVNTRR